MQFKASIIYALAVLLVAAVSTASAGSLRTHRVKVATKALNGAAAARSDARNGVAPNTNSGVTARAAGAATPARGQEAPARARARDLLPGTSRGKDEFSAIFLQGKTLPGYCPNDNVVRTSLSGLYEKSKPVRDQFDKLANNDLFKNVFGNNDASSNSQTTGELSVASATNALGLKFDIKANLAAKLPISYGINKINNTIGGPTCKKSKLSADKKYLYVNLGTTESEEGEGQAGDGVANQVTKAAYSGVEALASGACFMIRPCGQDETKQGLTAGFYTNAGIPLYANIKLHGVSITTDGGIKMPKNTRFWTWAPGGTSNSLTPAGALNSGLLAQLKWEMPLQSLFGLGWLNGKLASKLPWKLQVLGDVRASGRIGSSAPPAITSSVGDSAKIMSAMTTTSSLSSVFLKGNVFQGEVYVNASSALLVGGGAEEVGYMLPKTQDYPLSLAGSAQVLLSAKRERVDEWPTVQLAVKLELKGKVHFTALVGSIPFVQSIEEKTKKAGDALQSAVPWVNKVAGTQTGETSSQQEVGLSAEAVKSAAIKQGRTAVMGTQGTKAAQAAATDLEEVATTLQSDNAPATLTGQFFKSLTVQASLHAHIFHGPKLSSIGIKGSIDKVQFSCANITFNQTTLGKAVNVVKKGAKAVAHVLKGGITFIGKALTKVGFGKLVEKFEEMASHPLVAKALDATKGFFVKLKELGVKTWEALCNPLGLIGGRNALGLSIGISFDHDTKLPGGDICLELGKEGPDQRKLCISNIIDFVRGMGQRLLETIGLGKVGEFFGAVMETGVAQAIKVFTEPAFELSKIALIDGFKVVGHVVEAVSTMPTVQAIREGDVKKTQTYKVGHGIKQLVTGDSKGAKETAKDIVKHSYTAAGTKGVGRIAVTAGAAGARIVGAGARIVAQPAVSVVSFFKDRADGKSKMFCGKRSSGKKKGEEVCDGDRCSEGGDEGCVTDEENPQAKGTKKMKCVSIGFPHVNGRCRFQTGKGSGHGTLMTNAFCEDDEECGPNEKCAARTKTCSPK